MRRVATTNEKLLSMSTNWNSICEGVVIEKDNYGIIKSSVYKCEFSKSHNFQISWKRQSYAINVDILLIADRVSSSEMEKMLSLKPVRDLITHKKP